MDLHAGILLADRFHQILGCYIFLVPMVAILNDQIPAGIVREQSGSNGSRLLHTALASTCFYFTFARLRNAKDASLEAIAEVVFGRALSYAAFGLILVTLWVQLPGVWVAPAIAVLMLLLFELSAAHPVGDLRMQSYAAAGLAALAGLVLTATSRDLVLGVSARTPAMLILTAAYYVPFLRQAAGRVVHAEIYEVLRPVFAWAGTASVALLICSPRRRRSSVRPGHSSRWPSSKPDS